MDPTIPTIIIASAAFILSIFAANWLNLRSNEKLFERLDKQLAAQFGEVRAEIAAVRAEMRAEFAAVRAEIAMVRAEMRAEFAAVRAEIAAVRAEIAMVRAEVTTRLDALEDKVDRLDRQMEAIFKPVMPKT